MKYIFGPVSSRRFGSSLGIDLSPNIKQCNFNCLYCELTKQKAVEKMSDIIDFASVLSELQEALEIHKNIDIITITANGEPTLYPKFSDFVSVLKALNLKQKLLILSNASAIDKNFETLLKFDIVKFSLDAATQKTFQKIDNPKNIKISQIIENIEKFSKEFSGDLVIEILVVEGINDSVGEFEALNTALNRINPKRIDLGTIDRPPAFDVKPVSREKLEFLATFIENQNINIVAKPSYKAQKMKFSTDDLLHTIARRPQRIDDIKNMLDSDSLANLEALVSGGLVILRGEFYTLKER